MKLTCILITNVFTERSSMRKDSCPRRRGIFRKPHFIYIGIGVLFIYIVYRSFFSDSNAQHMSYDEHSRIAQNRLVQGELRTEQPNFEKHEDPDTPEKTRERNEDDGSNPAIRIGNDAEEIKEYDEDKDNNEDDNLRSKEQEDVRRYHLMENLIPDNTTEGNKINDQVGSINGTTKIIGNESNRTLNVNMTLTEKTADLKLIDKDAELQRKEFEINKAKLVEDILVQTQELTNFVRDALAKSIVNSTDIYYQNKTKVISENVTKLIDSYKTKAQNTVKLASNLLGVQNASLSNENVNAGELNKTKLEAMYAMEANDLVKTAKEVLLKTNKSATDSLFESKTRLIEKFAFDAQKLAKIASTMLNNTLMTVPEVKPKLQDSVVPLEKSPSVNFNQNMTRENLTITLTNGTA